MSVRLTVGNWEKDCALTTYGINTMLGWVMGWHRHTSTHRHQSIQNSKSGKIIKQYLSIVL